MDATDPVDAMARLAELEQQNAALNGQLARFVQAERHLYISRRDLARQLAQVHRLGEFARVVSGTPDPGRVLGLGAEMLLDLFALDQAVGFLVTPLGRLIPASVTALPGRGGGRGRGERLGRRRADPMDVSTPDEVLVGSFGELAAKQPSFATIMDAFDQLFQTPASGDSAHHQLVVLPLRHGPAANLGLLVLRRLHGPVGFHDVVPSPDDLSFLRVAAQQISGSLAQVQLIEQARLAALGQLAAVMAHELRNPLAVIYNGLGRLRRLVPSAGDEQTLIGILGEEAERLNQIVGDLLTFVSPRAPQLRDEDLGKLARDAVDGALASQDVHGVQVSVEAEPGLGPVPVEARMIRQVLVNLATNALHSMPRGGELTVQVGAVQRGGHELVAIRVRDTGTGISDEHLGRIFDPFFTTKVTGTGLGLALVKRHVEAHQGEIRVETGAGTGTTFTILLPKS